MSSSLTAFFTFTCLQILNFARQFREIGPNGLLTGKEFFDCIDRFSTLSIGTQLVPEVLSAIDSNGIQQICALLDPFESGFVSWRKYLYIQTRVLPVPSAEYLVSLKHQYQNCASYKNGKVVPCLYFLDKIKSKDEKRLLLRTLPLLTCGSRRMKHRSTLHSLIEPKNLNTHCFVRLVCCF